MFEDDPRLNVASARNTAAFHRDLSALMMRYQDEGKLTLAVEETMTQALHDVAYHMANYLELMEELALQHAKGSCRRLSESVYLRYFPSVPNKNIYA